MVTINGQSLGHADLLRLFYYHLVCLLNDIDSNLIMHENDSSIIYYNILDEKFLFFNGFNLLSVINGKRLS